MKDYKFESACNNALSRPSYAATGNRAAQMGEIYPKAASGGLAAADGMTFEVVAAARRDHGQVALVGRRDEALGLRPETLGR